MPNHFSAVGFKINQPADLEKLLAHMASVGETLHCERGIYQVWKLEPGIELWANATKNYEVAGFNPHFSGSGRVNLVVGWVAARAPKVPLESTVMGNINATAENPSGDAPIVIDMPDFDLRNVSTTAGTPLTLQVAAFANDLQCFATDDAYAKSQKHDPKFAPEFFIPSGLFSNKPHGVARADAMMAGHIQQAELVVNPYTRQEFHHLVVSSLPGTLDIVADPAVVKGKPVVGGVVGGSFWLTGRLVDA